MTYDQRELARHALGLDSRHKRSYRNRFVCESNSPDGVKWMAMCAEGYAQRRDSSTLPFGGCDMFWLTPKGAEAALNPGESLDREDFPQRKAVS